MSQALTRAQGLERVNDFVIKAAAMALKAVPEANASYTPEGIAMHHNADVSMAVAIDGGLITPIIRKAELSAQMSDRLCTAAELARIAVETGAAVVFVTHSIPEAVFLSDRVVVMSPRPGRITDVIDSPLPRERPLDIRDTPEFIQIAHRVREGLRAGHSDE